MARDADDISMALFCDFENIALGVRDAQYEKFDIRPVLDRLLTKGSIVVKKAYCDWERYKSFKGAMHEANFELIEIPHVRQSGKNSADIRMVVDALDLCYTKSHVNTFVIISGDSDFSPLVSKLRENAKRVIGVGVKQSTSDLLIANCDEFIYIDDLLRRRQRDTADKQNRRPNDPQEHEARRLKGLNMAVATVEALLEDRADDEKVWASVVKEALKRRHPGFNESYFGFKSFGAMLEDAHRRGFLEFGRDEKSGTYVKRRPGGAALAQAQPEAGAAVETPATPPGAASPAPSFAPPSETPTLAETTAAATAEDSTAASPSPADDAAAPAATPAKPKAGRNRRNRARPAAEASTDPAPSATPSTTEAEPTSAAEAPSPAAESSEAEPAANMAGKKTRRPRSGGTGKGGNKASGNSGGKRTRKPKPGEAP